MGQFYKTSKPTFVEDIMYTPPWELYKDVIAVKDKQIDDELAKTAALEGALDFKYLDFDKEKAEEKKLFYKAKIEDLANKIKQDPENYRKYSQDIYAVQKELLQDFTTGEISAITGDYAGMEKFMKDHEKYKQKFGDRYEAGLNAFYNEAKEKRTKNGYVPVWDSEQLMEGRNFMDDFAKQVSKLKPNITAYASTSAKGGYIFKDSGTNKTLSEQEVQNLMMDVLKNSPNIEGYMAQSNRIGLPVDVQGLLDYSKNFAYTEEKKSASRSGDPVYLTERRFTQQKEMENIKQNNKISLINYRQTLKDTGFAYNGELQTAPLLSVLGQGLTGSYYNDNKVPQADRRPNNTLTFGMPALVGAGIMSSKDAASTMTRINKFSLGLNNFGNKDIVFVPNRKVEYVVNGKKMYLQPNTSYIMNVGRAKKLNIIKDVVKSSGQPFYIDDKYNGARYSFTTKDGGTIEGSLMPTGTHPQIKEGIQILSLE